MNGLPLEGQRHEIMYKRRHGMGILGLAQHWPAMLRITVHLNQSNLPKT